ncbi:MAG: hypothetical protein ABSA96_15145 [Candidatus Acidiferrales bacterium]|jgi:hypothetical protein
MNDRTKRIWQGLVDYANASPTAIDIAEFRRTVAACMPGNVLPPWQGSGLGLLDREDLVAEAAGRYHSQIQGVLRWFVVGKPNDRDDLFRQGFGFLREHMQHIKWVFNEANPIPVPTSDVGVAPDAESKLGPNSDARKDLGEIYTPADIERFEEASRKYWAGWKAGDSPLGIWTPAKDYEDLADPICDFLLTEYQKYRDRDPSRLDRRPPLAVPILICPKCGRFVMPQRVGRKQACSDCSDQVRREKKRLKDLPFERADYQFLYRLKTCGPAERKLRLRQPKVQKRLKLIKERQKDSALCQGVIVNMKF